MTSPESQVHDRAESWPVTSSQDLYRDDWVMALRADTVHRPGHEDEAFRRLVLEHPGAVVVLAIDEQGRVPVLQQYRHPAQRRFVELPAGLLDASGEEPLVTAQRELLEEAGLQAEHWEPLISTYASAGILTERHFIFVATGLSAADRGDFVLEHEEADMGLEWIDIKELQRGVMAGELQNSGLVIAVLAHAMRSNLTAKP